MSRNGKGFSSIYTTIIIIASKHVYYENLFRGSCVDNSAGPIDARFLEIRWLRSQGFVMRPIYDDSGELIGFQFYPEAHP